MKLFSCLLIMLLSIFCFFAGNLYAQPGGLEEWVCGTEFDLNKNPEHQMLLGQFDGKYITAKGELKVLVVFVQFSDDSDPNSDWPPGQAPNFMNSFIDPTSAQNSTNYANLTNYFDVMSSGAFQFIGDAKHTILPNTQQWYKDHKPHRSDIIRETLERLDPQIDFSQYDNWGIQNQYIHENEPDGVVDMVIMIFRNVELFTHYSWSGWAGEASLGYGNNFVLDGTTIKVGYGFSQTYGVLGSGVTVKYLSRDASTAFITAKHEFGHWLLGAHPYNTYERTYSVWGILGRWTYWGFMANAFEREQLGWINVIEVTDDLTLDFPIYDFLTAQGYGYNAVKYHPPGGEPYEYYYFENHQKLHLTSDGKTYDDATLNPADKGIFIVQIRGSYSETNNVRCKTSDGLWNWQHVGDVPNIWGTGTLPLFRRGTLNISGDNYRRQMLKNGGGWEWIWAQQDAHGDLLYGWFFKG